MKYALINYKKANLDSTIKGLFHLSINDLENYLSFIQCPHVFMSTRLHIYTYTSGLIYMFTYNHVFTSIWIHVYKKPPPNHKTWWWAQSYI